MTRTRICLISPPEGPSQDVEAAFSALALLLARAHEVTVVHTRESDLSSYGDSPRLRHLTVTPERLPGFFFACEEHARSAAAMLAIEEAYGDDPPDYLEVPDRGGQGVVPLQARAAGHSSLRGTSIGVRLYGTAELAAIQDGAAQRPGRQVVFDLEREALRLADRVVCVGGDVPGLYERCLGAGALPTAPIVARLPLPAGDVSPPGRDWRAPVPGAGEAPPLRILYASPLQRAAGALSLLQGCLALPRDDWRLTLTGADTDSGPLGQSMRAVLEAVCAGDPRIAVEDEISPGDLEAAFAKHDMLAVPPGFTAWSGIALAGMRAGVPILATPVGDLVDLVEPGVTGWLAGGIEPDDIRASLESLLDRPDESAGIRASGKARQRFERLMDPQEILNAYHDLLGGERPKAASAVHAPDRPLVSGIIPYYGEHEHVGAAVRSLLSQTYPNVEAVIVNDGSFRPEDRILDDLAAEDRVRVIAKPNGGENEARNLGAVDAEGRYLVMLDADNVLEPEFVERAVEILEADPELAYVTCWLRYIGPSGEPVESKGYGGYAALGNAVRSEATVNDDGDAAAVLPRRLFSRLGYRYEEMAGLLSDWELYRRLREDGRLGAVIPEPLVRYRIRGDSLSNWFAGDAHARAWGEAQSRRRARAIEWTATV
jgi:glycogen synthase